ncbi:maltokinase N-terminal cap-like domain-containing protein [Nocardioides sp.]|uniref:maltokinase N-terminal cap-like domain-containing protein n=1 Tax=Nocardioides sp. TaxID=35761 RepID=UPI00286E427B|nr:phosphotransferase [Nocardioides sp.]
MTESRTTRALAPALKAYIDSARWFGGKGRAWKVGRVRQVGTLPGSTADLTVVVELVEIIYAEGEPETYQVPLAFYARQQDRLGHALVGTIDAADGGPLFAYDAAHDRDAMDLWLRAFAAAADGKVTADDLAFHRVAGHVLDTEAHSTLFTGEQSNSSVAFGEDSLLKIFRKVTPGVNPDVSIHEVLTRAGSDHVAELYGWLDVVDETTNSTIQLAMLQQFLRTATDGWELALASVRNLYAEADLHADEVGGDFAGEAARLGRALAETHQTLAENFPVATRSADEMSALADAMRDRLRAAIDVVPALANHVEVLEATYDALAALGDVPVQQVHGDLHLGQTLRTVKGWKIVDFEGEPARPLAERLLPDSPWRDVAGMLRSFDYAPRVVTMTSFALDPGVDEEGQQAYRAAEWSKRNAQAFLASYAERELSGTEQILLAAYVADKAVYETVYEARNRPSWVEIPLDALDRLSRDRTESA